MTRVALSKADVLIRALLAAVVPVISKARTFSIFELRLAGDEVFSFLLQCHFHRLPLESRCEHSMFVQVHRASLRAPVASDRVRSPIQLRSDTRGDARFEEVCVTYVQLYVQTLDSWLPAVWSWCSLFDAFGSLLHLEPGWCQSNASSLR